MNEDLKNLILKSGNNLHMKVVKILEEKGWEDIDIGSYYYDDITNKPREIDIIAKHKVFSFDHTEFDESKKFETNLFIECKRFNKEIAFRIHPPKKDFLEEALLIKTFPLLDGMKTKEEIIYRASFNLTHHHLKIDSLGKLYDALENNEVFNAIACPIKSYISFQHNIEQGISYLLVVYEGIAGIYDISPDDELKKLNGKEPKQISTIGINYSYKDPYSKKLITNQRFLIDFVHRKKLEEYLKIIIEETKALNFAVWRAK